MAIHRLPLSLNKKCTFYRLMGSGRNGTFDLSPDLKQWALLAVWENQEDFDTFYAESFVSRWWASFTQEKWTVLCEPLGSHGTWNNEFPFGKNFDQAQHNGPVAVLTRATIRLGKLKGFWSNVDQVAQLMLKAKGYIVSFGIGEAPVYKQATFSVWESAEDVKAFAYGSAEHRDVIKRTREGNWYSEELFARFRLIKSMGTLSGKDPLKNII